MVIILIYFDYHNDHMKDDLKQYLLKELPIYFNEIVDQIVDKEEISEYFRVKGLLKYGKAIISSEWGFCHSISHVVSQVLKELGKECRMGNFQVFLANKQAREIFNKQGLDALVEEIKRAEINPCIKAYTIGVGYNKQEPTDYHIACVFEQKILDMTIAMFRRQENGIIINNFFSSNQDIYKRFRCVLEYKEKDDFPKEKPIILEHPKYDEIYNTILKEISVRI